MNYTDLERLVLKHVRSDNYRPVKPRVIAKQLGLAQDRRPEVRKAIKRLAKRGDVAYGANHLVEPVRPAVSSAGHVVGVFHRTSSGFGFVRPRAAVASRTRQDDIYIPARRAGDASSGDVVRVRLRKPKRRGDEQKARGEIVEVLERETHQFVGTYLVRGELTLVQVDGRVFAQAIPVGDPGAKNVCAGDKVVIEMVRFPSHLHDGEAVIVEVLGPRGAPGVDTLSIIREFRLPEEFPEDVLESARRQADAFDPDDRDQRVDLTGLTVVTIDPADARDFDDAISLERQDNGHWRLGVHIADVAHFVPRKSPLDREARERGTSVYLPDRVIPMLPEIISNHLASLQPHQPRFAKTVFLEFTPDGAPVDTEIVRSAIKSDHRFNYEEVQQYLDNPQPWKGKLPPGVFALVGHMHELAMVLRRRRMEQGSLELILPEVKIELNDEGRVRGANIVQHTESHQIIEEFMLAANEGVAQWLTDQKLLFLRRIHAPPAPMKLRDLTQFVRELGIPCESLASRFEIKRVLEHVQGKPEEQAVNYAVLRSMQKAVYGPEEERHFALNKTHYCHFTSPIRRYPDLTIHRLLDALARGQRPPNKLDQMVALGQHCSDREQRAEAAERELIKLKLLSYLSEHIGRQMDAIITGVEEFGLFVQGVELPADGLIHISSLQDDYYSLDVASHSLVGRRAGNRYRLGDVVKVEVFHVDLDRRELDLRVVQPAAGARKGAAKGSRKRSTSTSKRRAAGRGGKKAKRGKRSR